MENDRIQINLEPSFEIVIKALFKQQQQTLLIVWMVLWNIVGLAVLSQFFTDQAEGFAIYLVVWMGFWAYFEYKVIYAYRWRKTGKERISLIEEQLIIQREIAGRSIPSKFDVGFIKNLKIRNEEEKSILTAMGKGYWSPSNEKITFDYKGKEIQFGMELEENDAKNILKRLKKQIELLKS